MSTVHRHGFDHLEDENYPIIELAEQVGWTFSAILALAALGTLLMVVSRHGL